MLRKEKGVTLVALVITIIVLLILAGVTISMVLGDDGMLQNATAAGKETEKAEIVSGFQLACLTVRTDELAYKNGAATREGAATRFTVGNIIKVFNANSDLTAYTLGDYYYVNPERWGIVNNLVDGLALAIVEGADGVYIIEDFKGYTLDADRDLRYVPNNELL